MRSQVQFPPPTQIYYIYICSIFYYQKLKIGGGIDIIYAKKDKNIGLKGIGNTNFKRIEAVKGNGPTWVCFLPWRVSFEEADKLGLIPKIGKVVAYEGPIGLADPNPLIAKELLEKLVNDLRTLELSNFNILSLSIGAYPSFYMANNFVVNKLVAVAPGSKLGDSIYKSVATQDVKNKAISLGFKNAEQYDSLIIGTNPIENLDNLPNDIEIHLATHDFYIPTIYGEELISELKKKNKNPKIFRYNGKGHVLTMLQFGKNNPY